MEKEMKNIFFDDNSSENLKKKPKRTIKKKSKYLGKDNLLLQQINESQALLPEEKDMYKAMAKVFLEDLSENLKKNHIELSRINSNGAVFTSDEWLGFLNTPPVSKYINQNNNLIASKAATSDVIQGGRYGAAAMKLKKEIDQASGSSNFNIVLIRVEDKEPL